MKSVLKISLALNVGLATGLLILISARRENHLPVEPQLSPQNAVAMNERLAPQSLPVAVKESEPPFSWAKNVEATDYPTYIGNLRRIGCPEQTLRDIITADVDNLYWNRIGPLEKQMNEGPITKSPALDMEIRGLRNEESALIASLLDPPQPANTTMVGQSSRTRRQQEPPSIEMPLFFQAVDVTGLKLDSGQAQAIEDLRQRFVAEIGGANQDPNDPAYMERWAKVQPEFENQMRGMIGVNAYQQYELAARNQSLSAQEQ